MSNGDGDKGPAAYATHEDNRRYWDEITPVHVGSALYDVQGFLAGGDSLGAAESALLGDVTGLRLLHLQCHFGLDSLSLARRGARVTGVDFSATALAQARRLACEAGLDASARFVDSDLLRLDDTLHERFDLVFTSIGTVCWLADINRWGEVVAAMTAEQGRFVFLDDHPVGLAHDPDAQGLPMQGYDYFRRAEPITEESGPDYADPSYRARHRNHSHIWPISDVLGALERAGMRVQGLREYDRMRWQLLPCMVRDEAGEWRLPAGMPRLPLMYSFEARQAGSRAALGARP